MDNSNAFLFIGDSFTWGQGLYFYSDLSNQKYPPKGNYIDSEVNELHRKFKDSKRFARLVASHFNTFEVVKDINGGSDSKSLEYIDNFFKKFSYNDVSVLIFQSTYFARSPFKFTFQDKTYSVDVDGYPNFRIGPDTEIFISWCKENQLSFEDYTYLHRKQIFDEIRDTFIALDNEGINVKFICWTNDYFNFIKEDAFMGGRFIKINHKGEEYNSFFDLMFFNKELSIMNDPYFDFSRGDGHLSLEAHKIVANSIINSIEKDLIEKNKKLI
jgi:hypothetical protein